MILIPRNSELIRRELHEIQWDLEVMWNKLMKLQDRMDPLEEREMELLRELRLAEELEG